MIQKILIATILICFIACGDEEPIEEDIGCISLAFDQEFDMEYDQMYCTPSGDSLMLVSITDDRCPCNADCIWEGEFVLDLVVYFPEGNISYSLHQDIVAMPNESLGSFNLEILDMKNAEDCPEDIQLEHVVPQIKITK